MKSDYHAKQDPALRDDFYLFLVSRIKGLGNATIYSLIKEFGQISEKTIPYLPDKPRIMINKALSDQASLEEVSNEWDKIDETFISIYHPKYPDLLKNIYDPPLFLFYRGNIDLLANENILTIVGSRTLTSYHESSVSKIISQLKNSPLIIASGMALGIDSAAHHAAIENRLPTIAVLGSGLDEKIIYPQKNMALARSIVAKSGLLISEISSNTKTQLHHFPKRNRILAGIARSTLIISGAKKSGTLITAQVALDEGRDVYALPGNIDSRLSEGPNNLINNGAHILRSGKDILKNYNINFKIRHKKIVFKNKTHAKIYSLLQAESLNSIKLARNLRLSPEAMNIVISEMELEGLVKINKHNTIEIL